MARYDLIDHALTSVSRRHQDLPLVTCALGLDLGRHGKLVHCLTCLTDGRSCTVSGKRRYCMHRPMGKRKYARISPIADIT